MASILDDKELCIVCCKKVTNKGVECDSTCKRWFHPDCVQLSAAEYKEIADGVIKTWTCDRADCATTKIDRHSLALDEILKKISSLATKEDVKGIADDISAIRQDVTKLSEAISELEPRLSKAEDEIKTIKSSITALETKNRSLSLEEVYSEVNDRSLRKSNIILHKVPESSKSPADLRISNVTVSRVRTEQERKHLTELRNQLEKRTNEGESGLTIKFVNGTPKIVKNPKN
ncbi:hypothetical protein J6590_017015 [Homalodisca vitripennis]|nr:hypothetical protein J6590_017015 [Homalodisca vitripennis]